MKKFFAGVSVLAVVVGGLAGCGSSTPDRDEVQGKLKEALLDSTPDQMKEQFGDMADKLFDCVSEKTVKELDDDQLAELNKAMNDNKDMLTTDEVPKDIYSIMEDSSATCTVEIMQDMNK